MLIWDQFGIIQSFQRSPIPQTSNWPTTFFYTIQQSGSSNAFTYESLLLHQQDVLKTQSQEGYVLKYFSSKIRYATIYQPQLFEFSYPRPYSQMQCGVIGEASKYGTHTYI